MSTTSNPIAPCDEEEEEQLNICLRVIKTVNFKVRKTETVGRVKSLLYGKEGIPESLQELFFCSNHLESDKRLVDYGISSNSTLNAYVSNSVPLRLSIKIPSRKKTIMVQVRSQDTIQNVKAFIEAKESIGSDQYNLVYAGKLLEDDNKTFAFLDIHGESTLHVVFIPKDVLQVSVKMLSGETVKIQVRTLHTILDVKTLLESNVGYPVRALSYDGKNLDDSKTVSYYNITTDDTISEIASPIQVFIKWSGKSTSFDILLVDLVIYLKKMISSKFGVPVHVQRLVFEGKLLDDFKDLASYGIQKDSNILLSYSQAISVMKIKLSKIHISDLELSSCKSIESLKRLVGKRLGVHVNELRKRGGPTLIDACSPCRDYSMTSSTQLEVFFNNMMKTATSQV
ncbi:unnamed protein product [Cuscuta epithymum]|uniref:Ubiquitin-like domain-containing protein n=1 Tax=Cuscuta epithymum TaxID=186058 RepID=A0AAV0FCG2_9ASTE|nr:unnamed protein product [Cuscuta epithymum]